MLTRRGFVGCALCAVAGFSANEAFAQQGTQTPGLKRTLISRMDGPTAGYETIEMKIEIEADATVARHTHFGIETGFVVDGSLELTIEGVSSKTYGKGEGFQVPAGAIHGGKGGPNPIVITSVYVVEKGKPLATPA
jgi:quercetin dioxygenase-like cupin family protein